MKKQYKIQLPKGKKVTMTNVDFEDGVMTVNVEFENRKEPISEAEKVIKHLRSIDWDKRTKESVDRIRYELYHKKHPETISNYERWKSKFGDINEQKYDPKEGDILYGDSLTRNIIIYKGTNERGAVLSYAGLASFSGINRLAICDETYLGFGYASEYTRYATDEEKQLLFDALSKEGKRWNPETKQIEDFPRWRANRFGTYYYVQCDTNVTDSLESNTGFDDLCYKAYNYFKTRDAAEKVAEQIREIFKNSKAE